MSAVAAPSFSASPNLLTNPGFETGAEDAWYYNSWGSTQYSHSSSVTFTVTHDGSSNYTDKITITSPGSSDSGLIFCQDYTLQKGVIYDASVWLKSDTNMKVQFLLRRSGANYDPCASYTVDVGPTWQKLSIHGGFADAGNVATKFALVLPRTAGSLWVDDASLTVAPPAPIKNAGVAVPPLLFGVHLNQWGIYTASNWPNLNVGMQRLWDNGCHWANIEPSPGQWYWDLMDNMIDNSYAHGQEVIYCMGLAPAWARANPGDEHSTPANLADWTNYVTTVATRYQGKLKYFEVWNEINGFYSGTMPQMIQLTIAARQALDSVDPDMVLLSANVSTSLDTVDEFLYQGGGAYVDGISWHQYTNNTDNSPELEQGLYEALHDIMNNHGVGDMPLFNTEGNAGGIASPTDAQARSYIARNFVVEWLNGISNFNFYCWDNAWNIRLSQSDDQTLNAAGIAYNETVSWLKGSSVTARTIDANGTWIVDLTRSDSTPAHIVWNPTSSQSFTIPGAWGNVRQLDLSGGVPPGPISNIVAALEPVLLEEAAPRSPTPTSTPSPSPSMTPTATASPTRTRTVSPSGTASSTHTANPSLTATPTLTGSPSVTATSTRTASPSVTATSTRTGSPSVTATPSATTTSMASVSPSASVSASGTASPTSMKSATATPSLTASPTRTTSPTASVSVTQTMVMTGTATESSTPTPTSTPTAMSTGPSPSPSGAGSLEVLALVALPNPNPAFIHVQLTGPCDQIKVQAYSASLAKAAVLTAPCGNGQGWVAVDASGLALPNGLWYMTAVAEKDGKSSLRSTIGRLLILK